MTGGKMILGGVAGLTIVGVVGLVLSGGDGGEEPAAATTVTVIVETPATATTTAPAPASSVDQGSADQCSPDPGVQVTATGPIDGFPPGEEVDGITVVGSAAQVNFRLDAPGNRNVIVFRLVYLEATDIHSWTEAAWYEEGPQLDYEAATHRLSGWFMLSHTINPAGAATADPERAGIELIYDPGASRLSGAVTHPDATFTLDLAAEELARDFFADPSCYPDPVDNPG